MTNVEQMREQRSDLLALAEGLIAQYDWLPAGRVIATVAVCRSELSRMGVRGVGLIDATRAMACARIDATEGHLHADRP